MLSQQSVRWKGFSLQYVSYGVPTGIERLLRLPTPLLEFFFSKKIPRHFGSTSSLAQAGSHPLPAPAPYALGEYCSLAIYYYIRPTFPSFPQGRRRYVWVCNLELSTSLPLS
ncbi:hypothetical protein AURDEDRAFT_112056 [Auricularia subglabra TFB-10046 SS5]|nr:hypothetical protein AURDEDRAFT_112056 [Auricularia subglabra TFB-10046 SS5]